MRRDTSTASGSHTRDASTSRHSVRSHDVRSETDSGLEKFPDHFDPRSESTAMTPNGYALGGPSTAIPNDRWQPRRESSSRAGIRWEPSARGHRRQQRSFSEAFHNLRERRGSVTQNATEMAGALRAPVSPMLIVLCLMWYTSSALTNTSSKSILNAFDKPATLTMVQFYLVAFYCVTLSWLSRVFPTLQTKIPVLRHAIRYPTRDVIEPTLPMAAFQIMGHLLSSKATSMIPVSMVHTIKGLSPLFTVLAYRALYNIQYPRATYYSLVPLTAGVMLACSGKHSFKGEFWGIFCALLATLVFVAQNIFSKKLFNDAAAAESEGRAAGPRKLDKLNLLCYSSGMAFVLTTPIWLWSEGFGLIGDFFQDGSLELTAKPNSFDHGRLLMEFLFNGTFHFGQNILAFVLLSMVSPVTYSVASLIKRVWVIIASIIWFWQPTTSIQAVGIALTALGLYLYDRANDANKADKRARNMSRSSRETPLLPLNTNQPALVPIQGQTIFESPRVMSAAPPLPHPYTNGPVALAHGGGDDFKKTDEAGKGGRQRAMSNMTRLAPGTRQEDTWRLEDRVQAVS